jgi:2-desacetyl-2-hydroxyethyl bacteriochlorophyllide A dehydrogenase
MDDLDRDAEGSRKGTSLHARALWFTAPRRAEVQDEVVLAPKGSQLLVRAVVSLVSAGTELLVYRGEVPAEDALGLETGAGNFGFPVKYAYQVIGEVVEAGADASFRPGELVFCRHPHQSLFTLESAGSLVARVPSDLSPERAAFVNLLEVGLNAMLDVPVRLGEVVVVYGQGVVGSFCAQLARRTAGTLIVVDPIEARRARALSLGADAAVPPDEAGQTVEDLSLGRGADVCIEASGAPAALQGAIEVTGQEGTIVAVSYFGSRLVPLLLSPEFHFRRQRITSSQVSSLGSGLQPRWTLERRNRTAFDLLRSDWLDTPVSHRFAFERAPEAYRILDQGADRAMGILLDYTGGVDPGPGPSAAR